MEYMYFFPIPPAKYNNNKTLHIIYKINIRLLGKMKRRQKS